MARTSSTGGAVIAFVDERIETNARDELERVIVGCCVFGHDVWMAKHGQASRVGATGRRRRLEAIHGLLEALGGIAVLAYADVPRDLLTAGEIDSTDDIPRMSRTDNVWSQVVLSGLAASLAWLMRSGLAVGAFTVYYDRRDLTAAHRLQFENTLRDTLPKIARAAYPMLGGGDPSRLVFEDIVPVGKPAHGTPTAQQRGTSLAHHLCAQARKIIERGSEGRVLVRDHSDVIRSMIAKFQGGAA